MDTMDLDVEMDVDVDLVPDEPIIPEPELQDAPGNRSPGEVDDVTDNDTPVPTKVHIRGLDVMNPDDVKSYVAEHFPDEPVRKIEWIDDSSANLLFASDLIATRALNSLIAEDVQDVTQLSTRKAINAKSFSKRPEVSLQVRLAVVADRKQAGSASRSRFYLLNPGYDPEERWRRSEARRYRDRGGDIYGRRRERESRYQEFEDQFDASLYDDDEATLTNRALQSRPRPKRSYASDTSDDKWGRADTYRNENRGKELFPLISSGRSGSQRQRSASPRDRHGDETVGNATEVGPANRNRERARAIKSRLSRTNRARELFPDEPTTEAGRLGDDVEDTTTLLSKGIILPLMDGSNDTPTNGTPKLEDRITFPGKGQGFSIRGTASQRSTDQGFAIKGNAGKSAKELFPEKLGINSGKELFADRLEGRLRQRQRAGDLFD
ncbi:uncharacterized protein GGS22DRAFT_173560 [Annulohypoxylon maeteangense]|uniref:uncharacterized protein n=1 Tax=Annulohypoxylon maeteangense TaxID=1927788 RepID=UPI002008BA8F|nr:uncharacterized protein GGS22DRAFT_173560 [Annulohypoxylon maeteangense]KAI0881184.1 hypothetical protein GGS22DRAFT_173560 [Annulohypoxylon maeteangense]